MVLGLVGLLFALIVLFVFWLWFIIDSLHCVLIHFKRILYF